MRVEAKNAGNIGFAAGDAFFQPEDVERGIGEIAGEQIVQHRGLARGLFVECCPVQRVEKAVAAIGIACDPGSVGLDAGDGEMDIHGRYSFRHVGDMPPAPTSLMCAPFGAGPMPNSR